MSILDQLELKARAAAAEAAARVYREALDETKTSSSSNVVDIGEAIEERAKKVATEALARAGYRA